MKEWKMKPDKKYKEWLKNDKKKQKKNERENF